MISYGKHYVDQKDIQSVLKVLKSNWITQGPNIKKFENLLKKKFKSKFCIAVSNGTAALHLAGLCLGWKPGDIVITTPMSFLSTSNCIIYSGAIPVFVDIDSSNYNIDLKKLEKKIKHLKKNKKKVKSIIATDYAGNPCDWQKLKEISTKYSLTLINDNCHAIGAAYQGNQGYAVKYADIVTHSYHAVKNITTGEGGAILTNNKNFEKKLKNLRSHGVTRDRKKMNFDHGPWYYEMQELGYNYRITDFQCALGISQISKLNKFLKKRKKIAKIYDKAFSNKKIIKIPQSNIRNSHAYHIYPLLINFNKLRIKKNIFFKKMIKNKIFLQVHYIPIHLQPYYKRNFKYKVGDFPVAEKFYKDEVSLPIYYSLKDSEVYRVIKLVKKYCK